MYSLFSPLRYASFFPIPCSRPGPTLWMGWICLGIVSLGGRRPLLPLPLPPSKDTNTLPSLSRIIMHGYILDRERKITHYYSREKRGEKRHTTRVYCVYEGTATLPRERKISFSAFQKMRGKHRCVFTKSGKEKKIYLGPLGRLEREREKGCLS